MRYRRTVLGILAALIAAGTSASAYAVEPPPWAIEGAKQVAKEAVEMRERENAEAAAKKTAEERAGVEVREREEREHAAAEATRGQEAEKAEQGARVKEAKSVACRVPNLRGHSLAAARRLLGDSHCTLGRVRDRRAGHVAQVVVRQSVGAGARRPSGTLVTVTLGLRR